MTRAELEQLKEQRTRLAEVAKAIEALEPSAGDHGTAMSDLADSLNTELLVIDELIAEIEQYLA
jgi:DNA replication protein DnaC